MTMQTERFPTRDTARLDRIGRLLYGEAWQAPMARDLGVGPIKVRAWAKDWADMTRDEWAALARLCADRVEALCDGANECADRAGGIR